MRLLLQQDVVRLVLRSRSAIHWEGAMKGMIIMNCVPDTRHGWLLSPFLQDIATFYTALDVLTRQKVLLLVPPVKKPILIDLTR